MRASLMSLALVAGAGVAASAQRISLATFAQADCQGAEPTVINVGAGICQVPDGATGGSWLAS